MAMVAVETSSPSPAMETYVASTYDCKYAGLHERGLVSGPEHPDEKDELRLNLQRMQWRVVELEKVCREMKGQMSKMVRNKAAGSSPSHHNSRGLPRLC